MTEQDVGSLAGPLLLLAFVGWLSSRLMWRRRKRRAREPAADEPVGTPYRIYTTRFDRVAAAREAPAIVAAEDRHAGVGPPRNVASFPQRIAAARRWRSTEADMYDAVAAKLSPALRSAQGDLVVSILVDHSGSIKEEMIAVAATMRWLSDLFDDCGVPVAIAGYTTVGWRGGAARRQWMVEDRPKRPGRLCATLHLSYRDFDERLDDDDWQIMLDPAVLRENVDGEALQWAAARLAYRPEHTKLLIVVSDGAPVDDSTLMENGIGYLVRHLRSIVADLQETATIRLGAVGINYRVDEYYDSSATVEDLEALPSAIAQQIVALMHERSTG